MKGFDRLSEMEKFFDFEKRTKINVQILKTQIFYEKTAIVTIKKFYGVVLKKIFLKT
jgi:hypothetical protein